MSACSNLESLVSPVELDRARGLLRGTLELTPLNVMLFSNANLKILQNRLRKGVFDRTGKIIDEQDSGELLLILRGVYLEYGKNRPTAIPQQIDELNTIAAKFIIDKVASEMEMYKTYVKDASSMPVPIELPKMIQNASYKQLPPPPAWI